MHDLISRQTAIDALGEEPLIWRNTLEEITAQAQWRQDRDAILSVPSVQPEGIKYAELSEDDYEKMAELMRKQPLQLIPAQPELHYCRECKWSRCHIYSDIHGKSETYWRCLNWDGETDEEGYCHEWKRKTDDLE